MDKYGGARYEQIGQMLHDQTIMGEVVKRYSKEYVSAHILSLDLGAGTGDTTAAVLPSDDRLVITAVDMDKERLDIAAGRFGKKIEFVQSDMIQYMKKQEGSFFDLIFSGFALHSLQSQLTYLFP